MAEPAVPSVVVLTRRADREAGRVAALLHRAGVPVVRLDADAAVPGGGEIRCTPQGALEIAGAAVRPTVTWLRHFGPRAVLAAPDPAADLFRRDAWAALARQLPLISAASVGHHDPGQLEQLRRAAALDVRTPRTVVTTDPAAAAAGLGCGRIVVKALDRHYVEATPGVLHWFLPVIAGADRTAVLPGAAPGTPLVVQEYVNHDREIRLYLTGNEPHAFEIAKRRPADLWTRPASVRVTAVPPPPRALAAARVLATAFGLRHAAFDFLMQGEEPVFLELNVHGDWRWFERRAGVETVTGAMARTLAALHRAATTRGGRLELLPFLGAGGSGP
ncbi:hypothetical protein ABH931_001608 [Streptacidiphilus sp. MAP12-33]|uniref:hypothetical protein n=1 Tax=Streptacidiphilus sp. MAP12-33 TaxID=3156266 RepID=UPI0035166842